MYLKLPIRRALILLPFRPSDTHTHEPSFQWFFWKQEKKICEERVNTSKAVLSYRHIGSVTTVSIVIGSLLPLRFIFGQIEIFPIAVLPNLSLFSWFFSSSWFSLNWTTWFLWFGFWCKYFLSVFQTHFRCHCSFIRSTTLLHWIALHYISSHSILSKNKYD